MAFKCTSSGYVINDKDYLYGLTSYTSGIGTISGADVLSRLSNLAGSLSVNFGSIGSLGSLGGVSGGYFNGLPAWNDCDKFVRDGNIA